MKRRLSVLLAALALFLTAWPALAAPPMWVAEGKHGGRVVLFGSVHLLSDRAADWRTPELDAEIAKAGTLWFEIPFDPVARGQASTAASIQGFLPEGQTLRSLMTPADRARLERIAPTLKLDLGLLDRLKPWLAEVMLTTAQAAQSGASESLGVESQLQAAAPASIPRRAFETPAEQIGFFSSAPMTDQLASLADSLRQIEEEPDAFSKLEDAWLGGDIETLIEEAVEPLKREAPGLYERLVAARNRRWTVVIEGLLKRREHALIVVGVGHLVGRGSVPELLRARGIRVHGP